jgi:hypothetical protein
MHAGVWTPDACRGLDKGSGHLMHAHSKWMHLDRHHLLDEASTSFRLVRAGWSEQGAPAAAAMTDMRASECAA